MADVDLQSAAVSGFKGAIKGAPVGGASAVMCNLTSEAYNMAIEAIFPEEGVSDLITPSEVEICEYGI